MSFKTKLQKQTCVYWAPESVDVNGAIEFAAPVEKDCRWEDEAQEFIDVNGNRQVSRSVVMVDGIALGGLLMLGTEDDITDTEEPRNNTDAWPIRSIQSIPNVGQTVTYTWAYL